MKISDAANIHGRSISKLQSYRLTKSLSFILVLFFYFLTPGFSQFQTRAYKWPGYIQLNDSVFISEREVSIFDYAEFLYTMKIYFGSYARFEEALPDVSIHWTAISKKGIFSINQLYAVLDATYHHNFSKRIVNGLDTSITYPSLISQMPIVNITRQQALLYCEFATKAFSTLKNNTRKKKNWRLPENIYYRLPTEEEWKLAASINENSVHASDSTNFPSVMNPIISKVFYDSLKSGEKIPQPVHSGHVNNRGLLNICGNVSEMLMDSPYTFGGSFLDSLPDYAPMRKSEIPPPQDYIGFRLVAVMKK